MPPLTRDFKRMDKKNSRIILVAFLALHWRSASAFKSQPIDHHHAKYFHSRRPSLSRHNGYQYHLGRTTKANSRVPSLFSLKLNSDSDEAAFVSSFLYEGTFQGIEDGLLSYLPDRGRHMPPKTRRLINRVTAEYVYGVDRRPQLDLEGVMEVIDAEYESLMPPVSLEVNNKTFDGGKRTEEQLLVQMVSLAVLYQLPKEITLCLLQRSGTQKNRVFADFCAAFEEFGWEKVSFPNGLGLRIERGLASRAVGSPSAGQSFFPPSRLPWRNRSKRKAAKAAQKGIMLAAQTEAPKQNIMTKEEFLEEIENEIRSAPLSRLPSSEPSFKSGMSLDEVLPSFPAERYSMAWKRVKRALMDPSTVFENNTSWKKFSSIITTQYKKLKQAGRAGLMAYAFINFVIYTVGMAWQWRRIAVEGPHPAGATLISLTMRKFATAFVRVYVGASLFKVVRIVSALALAPAAGRVLQFTQRKLRVSENTAFGILITLLLKTFFGTLTCVFLGDSALRKAIPLSTPITDTI